MTDTGPGSSAWLAPPAVVTSELAEDWLAFLPWAKAALQLQHCRNFRGSGVSGIWHLEHLGFSQVFLGREEAELPTSEQGPAFLAVSYAVQTVLLA